MNNNSPHYNDDNIDGGDSDNNNSSDNNSDIDIDNNSDINNNSDNENTTIRKNIKYRRRKINGEKSHKRDKNDKVEQPVDVSKDDILSSLKSVKVVPKKRQEEPKLVEQDVSPNEDLRRENILQEDDIIERQRENELLAEQRRKSELLAEQREAERLAKMAKERAELEAKMAEARAAKIMEELSKYNIVREDGKITLDNSTVLIGCSAEQSHIHRFSIADIISGKAHISANKNIKCPTCHCGTQFVTQCRIEAEKLYGRPFILLNKTTRGRPYTAELDGGDIRIECNKIMCDIEPPMDFPGPPNYTLYIVPYTTSNKKIHLRIGGVVEPAVKVIKKKNGKEPKEPGEEIKDEGGKVNRRAKPAVNPLKKPGRPKKINVGAALDTTNGVNAEKARRSARHIQFKRDPLPYTLAMAHSLSRELGGTAADYNIRSLGRLI